MKLRNMHRKNSSKHVNKMESENMETQKIKIPDKEKFITLDIETTGLRPWYGDEITCISAQANNDKEYFLESRRDRSEHKLIKSFLKWINTKKSDIKGLFVISAALKLLDHR